VTKDEFTAVLKRLKVSRAEAGRLLGLHRGSVCRFVTGERVVPPHVEVALANIEMLIALKATPARATDARKYKQKAPYW
jgi:hypothetical protein